MAGMTRRCSICNMRLAGIRTDWVLQETQQQGHSIATIGTSHNAPAHLKHSVDFQIASNLAAYTFDYDAILNLGFLGMAYVQCPSARNKVTTVLFPL